MERYPALDVLELAADTPVVIGPGGQVWHLTFRATRGRSMACDGRLMGLAAMDSLGAAWRRYLLLNRTLLNGEVDRLATEVVTARDASGPEREIPRTEVRAYVLAEVIPALEALEHPGRAVPAPLPSEPPSLPSSVWRTRGPHRLGFLASTCFFGGRGFPLRPIPAPASRVGAGTGAHTPTGHVAGAAASDVVFRVGAQCFAAADESVALDPLRRRMDEAVALELRSRAASLAEQRLRHLDVSRRRRMRRLATPALAIATMTGCLFENGWGGITESHDSVDVFMPVPAFAVEHVDGFLYAFPATRVTLSIRHLERSRLLSPGAVSVPETYSHPFVAAGGSLCMSVSGDYYRDACARPLADAILQLLADARHTLMFGFRRDAHPFRRLETFTEHRITAAEVAARRLPLFRTPGHAAETWARRQA